MSDKIVPLHGWETMELVANENGGYTITYSKTVKR